MSWENDSWLAFTLAMAIQDYEDERVAVERRSRASQKLGEEIAQHMEDIINLLEPQMGYIDSQEVFDTLAEGIGYIPLYCFYSVINKEKKATKEQTAIIKLFFNNLTFRFTYRSFVSAAMNGDDIADFKAKINLSRDSIGIFWKYLFLLLTKTEAGKTYREILGKVCGITIRFSLMGNQGSKTADGICRGFLELSDYHMSRLTEESLNEFPLILDKIKLFSDTYQEIIHADWDDFDEEMKTDPIFLNGANYMIRHLICDLILTINQPLRIQQDMIKDVASYLKLDYGEDPSVYLEEVYNGTGLGGEFHRFYSHDESLGIIWSFLYTIVAKHSIGDLFVNLLLAIRSILINVENHINNTYMRLGQKNLANNYMDEVINRISLEFET